MTNVRRNLAKVAVAAMLAGSLATAGSGVAGAAENSGVTNSGVHAVRHVPGHGRLRICQRERSRLAVSARKQREYASRTAAFVRLETRATKAGDTVLADYWAKVVSRRDAYSARQSARLLVRIERDAKVHGLVGGSCR